MNPTPAVAYRIAVRDAHAHLFDVDCTVTDPAPEGQVFRMPVWIPGSYLVREFARHVVAIRAASEGLPVAIVKEAKDAWRAAPCAGPLTVTITVYAFDLSVRAAYLDTMRGYFNGPCVFLRPDGHAQRDCMVEIVAPDADFGRSWRVATTLARIDTTAAGFGTYRAHDYDELIDHPVEMGTFALASFEAGGALHEIAVSGRHRADLDRLGADLARICQWQCDFFGTASPGRAPFDRYLFLVAAVGDGYGGLEHRASTSLLCSRDELPQPGIAKVSEPYRRFLGLASHEYFHAWNVKRIKPAAFTPYDLARENYTRQLWAFEGFTSYYDDLALVRSGVIDATSYLELLGRAITTLLRNPGRHVQSAAESSFDAWIKYYRRDENTPNAVVSYYVKGSLIGLALDLTLRECGSSLDALMRALWQRYGALRGVPEDGIAQLASELAGRDLGDFFARYVEGVEDPPFAALLAGAGVTLEFAAAKGARDRGGVRKTQGNGGDDAQALPQATLGADIVGGSEPRLQYVHTGGPAERAGLAAGDTLVAIDGLKASAERISTLLGTRRAGDTVPMHAFRRDELIAVDVTLAEAPRDTCWLRLDPCAAPEALARRNAWLGTER